MNSIPFYSPVYHGHLASTVVDICRYAICPRRPRETLKNDGYVQITDVLREREGERETKEIVAMSISCPRNNSSPFTTLNTF